MKTLNIKLDDWTHKHLKALAALKESTIAQLINQLVRQEIESNPDECELCLKYGRTPNEETLKSLHESQKGKGLSRKFKTSDELFSHLDSPDD